MDGMLTGCAVAGSAIGSGAAEQCPDNDRGPRSATVIITTKDKDGNISKTTTIGQTDPFRATASGSGFGIGGVLLPDNFNLTLTGDAAATAANKFLDGIDAHSGFATSLADSLNAYYRYTHPGGDGSNSIPSGFFVSSQQTGPTLTDVMSRARQLLQKPTCRRLFGNTNPFQLMDRMMAQGRIHVGSTYPYSWDVNTRTGKGIPKSLKFTSFEGTDYGAVTVDLLSSPQHYPARNPHIYFNGPGGVISDNLESAAAGLIHELLHVVGRIPFDGRTKSDTTGRQSKLNQAIVKLFCADQPITFTNEVGPVTTLFWGSK